SSFEINPKVLGVRNGSTSSDSPLLAGPALMPMHLNLSIHGMTSERKSPPTETDPGQESRIISGEGWLECVDEGCSDALAVSH
ncbi:hypothetical protein GWI33_009010, partial [Rhynchophorus ferrugineus]